MNVLRTINVSDQSEDLKEIHSLYDRNFPRNERMSFKRLMKGIGSDRIMHAYYDGDTLVGMAYVFLNDDLIYLGYLVTEENLRNKGYGSHILHALSDTYQNQRIVLDLEQLDENADNNEERERRRNFYLRNGFVSTGVWYRFFHVSYELLCMHGKVTGDDYRNLILKHWGPIAKKAVFQDHPFN